MNKQAGFSLIEIAIGLTVLGLLVGGFMQGQKAYMQEKTRTKERTVQEKITSSLAIFLQQNGHYPCPAAPNLNFNSPNFGKSAACTGGAVSQGAVPVRDLKLPLEMMGDTFGSKLTYAVTTARTNKLTYNTSADAVRILNPAGDVRLAPFVIVSHGPDKKGAYSLTGTTLIVACGTTARDSENCNGDDTFRDGLYAPASDINSTNRYDDTLIYSLAQQATTLWLLSPNATTGINIANRNTGNVGIGTSTPDSKLSVSGGDLNVNDAGAADAGDITTNGEMEAVAGSRIHAQKTIRAKQLQSGDQGYDPNNKNTGNIKATESAKAKNKMIADRFCYNIDLANCL